jgi:hypothetical protein
MKFGTSKDLQGSFLLFCAGLSLAWWIGCFAGVFEDFVVRRGGKSWRSCGELRGKRGRETTSFLGFKSTP